MGNRAYAYSAQTTEISKADQPDQAAVAKALAEENARLHNTNLDLCSRNRDLEDCLRATQKLVAFLVAVVAALGFFSYHSYQSGKKTTQQLETMARKNESLQSRIDSLEKSPIDLVAATVVNSTPVSKSSRAASNSASSATTSAIKDPVVTVWIPRDGKCYHDSYSCAGADPTMTTLTEAKKKGYERCGRCRPPW